MCECGKEQKGQQRAMKRDKNWPPIFSVVVPLNSDQYPCGIISISSQGQACSLSEARRRHKRVLFSVSAAFKRDSIATCRISMGMV